MPRQLFELDGKALQRGFELCERLRRQRSADEAKRIARAGEGRAEVFRREAVDEEMMHGTVLAPREISRGELAHAVRRAVLDYFEPVQAQQDVDQFVLVHLKCRDDVVKLPIVQQQ